MMVYDIMAFILNFPGADVLSAAKAAPQSRQAGNVVISGCCQIYAYHGRREKSRKKSCFSLHF
jgi:hypothetical protein